MVFMIHIYSPIYHDETMVNHWESPCLSIFAIAFSRGFVINELKSGQSVGEHNVLTEFFLGEASI